MHKSKPLKLVIVGQTPPPYNGQAKMIEVMLRGLIPRFDARFVRMNYSESVATAGKFNIGKVFHLFELIFRTWKALGWRRSRYLYYPPASTNLIPITRDILFLLAVRPFCKGLVLHFHAGGVSRYAQYHIMLRPFMRMAYGGMLAGIIQGDSCPDDPTYFNAKHRFVVPHGIDVPTHNRVSYYLSDDLLHILYVGIHTEEKGLFTLLDTAQALKNKGVGFIIHTVGRWYTEAEECRFLRLRRE